MTELENTNTGLHVGRAGTTAYLRLGTEAGPGLPRVGEQVGNQTRRERAGTGRTAVPSRAAGSGARAVHATPPGRGGAERGGRTKPRCQRAGGRKEKRRWWRRGAQQVSPVPGPARALRRAAPCHAGNGRSRAEPCGAERGGGGFVRGGARDNGTARSRWGRPGQVARRGLRTVFAVAVGPKVLGGGEREAVPGSPQWEEESVILSVTLGWQRRTPSVLRARLLPPGCGRPEQASVHHSC